MDEKREFEKKIVEQVKQYLEDNFNKDTANQYRSVLKAYFNFLQVEPKTYFDTNRNYELDVLKYHKYLKEVKDHAPKSIPPFISVIRNYLEDHHIEFSNRFWKQLAKRGKGHATIIKDRAPTITELKLILTLADAKERAFFLTMLSSGARESELIQLKVKDFDFNSMPVKITISGTIAKNKQNRITFITSEAVTAIKAWMKVKENYTDQNIKRFVGLEKYLKKKYQKEISKGDSARMFPFPDTRIRERWNALLEKTGLNQKDHNHYVLHLYTLKKFWNTRLKNVIPEHIVEILEGHEGYMGRPYDRPTEQELADWYIKGQDKLFVLEVPSDKEAVENIQAQVDQLQNQVKKLIKYSPWYKRNVMQPVLNDSTGYDSIGKPVEKKYDLEPIMSDKEAVKEYQKHQEIMDEIEQTGDIELWARKKRIEARKKQEQKKD